MLAGEAAARTNVVIIRSKDAEVKSDYRFRVVPPPSADDAAAKATISIIDGEQDPNGADLDILRDGKLPTEPDQPADNFFFSPGKRGGRLLIDLGKTIAIDQVNTYSWHPGPRGPQVYKLYASDGERENFNKAPKAGEDPKDVGWTFVAGVDARPSERNYGGKYGVSIFDSDGAIGNFRYLLFDISPADPEIPFGNTFYSEIDVVAKAQADADSPPRVLTLKTDAGQEFKIDTSQAPDLSEWAEQELAPVVKEWYPKIAAMLPSEGFEAPKSFDIAITPAMRGVAATRGTSIVCGSSWFRRNLKGEAKGAVVHELVHVVQQYGRARRARSVQTPGWLVEGIPDYIRWFLYEPQSRGAEIGPRNVASARYDDSYRISANFLNWVTEHHDREIVPKLNAVLRDGRYDDAIWKQRTGKSLEELGTEWKASVERALGTRPAEPEGQAAGEASGAASTKHNALSEQEKSEGWQLLFTGNDFSGWHNFGAASVLPGWEVKDGALVCRDPRNAGDLCTDNQFDWFELKLEYNISKGGNSGIMYRVAAEGAFPWESGPEFQLEDNANAGDGVRCGWLYDLYQPENDPKTGKPLDSTKPAGEWNEVRLLISPEKCLHEINGVKYFEYVLGSDEFRQRVEKSKFRDMARFAKSPRGYIALQGDHGRISFRNIKIRPIK
jgi:hypothetical protein